MIKHILLIYLLCLSTNSLASFEGQWVGPGTFDGHKRDGECSEIYLKLVDHEESFIIEEGSYQCGLIKAQYPRSEFKKNNGFLFYNGHKVGYYYNDEIMLSYAKGLYNLSLTKFGDQVHFFEAWEDEVSYLYIKGNLKFHPLQILNVSQSNDNFVQE